MMEHREDGCQNDDTIWETAQQASFLLPPREWTFGANVAMFGANLYHVDEASLYELALLDIHAQYWESNIKEVLPRYYRGLQFNVERCFQSSNSLTIRHMPSFLNPWLSRTIFRKIHNKKGRYMMLDILKDISEAHKSKLETGDFHPDDWKVVIGNRSHQEDLANMIRTICNEQQISKHGKIQYSWRLPIFHTVQWDNADNKALSTLSRHETTGVPHKWESVRALSRSHTWIVAGIPFTESDVNILLDGDWLNDNIIDAYLELCAYLRPDIKFLPTHWFQILKTHGEEASTKLAPWILKHAPDVLTAMNAFASVTTVINFPKDHWIALQFNPKTEILEVFDSLAPPKFSTYKKKLEEILRPLRFHNWKVQQGKNVPQQKGSSDCGVYACQFVKHFALDVQLFQSFPKHQSRWIRRMMAVEIADGRIRMPWD
ncbi:cysteine proteinase [Phlegmacium glaucopus]|nr:cysteine proteinase [Phlegmacium glaucopus]